MDMFLGAVFLKEPPLKLISKNGYEAIVPPAKVGGGVLSQPPLFEREVSVKIISVPVLEADISLFPFQTFSCTLPCIFFCRQISESTTLAFFFLFCECLVLTIKILS